MIRLPMLASVVALCLPAGSLLAKPPPSASANSLWFDNLEDPETTLSCCDEADCRPGGEMLRRTDNPTGRAVLCWSPAFGIMCFVPGPRV